MSDAPREAERATSVPELLPCPFTPERMRLERGWAAEQALSETPSLDGSRHMTTEQIAARSKRAKEARYGA